MNILNKIGWIVAALLALLCANILQVVLLMIFLFRRRLKPLNMLTVDQQIDKINNDVALELCWAESYEECDEIIEKGKQKIKMLTETDNSNVEPIEDGNDDLGEWDDNSMRNRAASPFREDPTRTGPWQQVTGYPLSKN